MQLNFSSVYFKPDLRCLNLFGQRPAAFSRITTVKLNMVLIGATHIVFIYDQIFVRLTQILYSNFDSFHNAI